MNESTPDTLTQRFDRLERETRRWKVFGSIAAVILAAVTVVNLVLLVVTTRSLMRAMSKEAADENTEAEETAVEEEVRAKRFVLVDDAGRLRAVLAMRAEGAVGLAFADADGNIIWRAP